MNSHYKQHFLSCKWGRTLKPFLHLRLTFRKMVKMLMLGGLLVDYTRKMIKMKKQLQHF